MSRLLIAALTVGLAAGVAAVISCLVIDDRSRDIRNSLEGQIAALEAQASVLYRGVYASGGGVQLRP